jgi:hypothetical protein
MGFSIKKGTLATVTALTIAVAFLVLAGCVTQGNDNAVIPGANSTPTTNPSGLVTPAEPVPPAGQELNLSIHSAQKFRMSEGTAPANNKVWVVIDLSIENRGFPGAFLFTRDAVTLVDQESGQRYLPEPHTLHLMDEWAYTPIAFNTSKRGEFLFATQVSPDRYVLAIHDPTGNTLSEAPVQTTWNREYAHIASETTQELADSSNFTAVVDQLDTPEKALQYMRDTFIFSVHYPGLRSYPPEEFFRVKKGDCKDYATFFSYVLAQHGYYAEIVSIKYSGSGHSVTIFRDDDGQLKYQSSDKMNGFRNVSSLEDLLRKEEYRSNAGPVVRYKVLPPGSVNMCTMPSGEC